MFRKFLMFSVLVLGFTLVFNSAFAVSGSSNTTSASSKSSGKTTMNAESIACVGKAVATREASISAAYATRSASVEAAYATRANELAGAYSNDTVDEVKAGVKVSWADFKKSVKNAKSKWKGDQSAAWTVFRSAVKACKAPSGVSDSANASAEADK